jgi:hypothetical protein
MIEQLMQVLSSTQDFAPTPAPAPVEPKFYVHFNSTTLQIKSISSCDVTVEDEKCLEVDYELGLKFITGEENPISWSIIPDDKLFVFQKIQPHTVKLNRVDIGLGIYEVKPNDWDDIRLKVLKDEGVVEIYYDGEKLKTISNPVKMYFTREGDMTYLKCAFSLDVNILNEITTYNNLPSWPNPIRLNLKDVDDLSVFAVRGPLSVSFQNG